MQNKKSIWSTLILIASIASLVLLIVSITLTAIGIPAVAAAAKEAAAGEAAADQAAIELAVSIAVGAVVVAIVFASIFDILKIIGGFLFSLKGKWGVFCIVVSILGAVGSFWTMISNISGKALNVGSLVVDIISLLVGILLVVACIMHYKENKQAA